jgi:hypothetical protein
MDFKLEVNNQSDKNPGQENQLKTKEFLADLDTHTIAKVFTNFSKEKRTLIMPIGFPQAGKSLLLSSLMHYAIKGGDTLFRSLLEDNFPYDKGRRTADNMKSYFESGKIYETTSKGTLDLIGIRMEPSRSKLPSLNLAFLDLAGEDIKKIKTSEGAVFTDKINAVFNGLKVDDSPIIFALITPFLPAAGDNETIEEAHQREDTLHYDFLNYITQNQPHILSNSKFLVIVSQWDKKQETEKYKRMSLEAKREHDEKEVETFIRTKRPSVYRYVANTNVIWGPYSIGKLLETKENGVNIQSIVRINFDFPARFWSKIYSICTNKSLEKKNWW